MTTRAVPYSFGPVPSRRLGRSLGVNNVPPKICSYSCVYCQVGRTTRMRNDRRAFYEPEDIFRDVRKRLARAEEGSERVDWLTFVPDGEPTLDINLGREIKLLKALSVPVAVVTNSSLLWRDDVQEELGEADWVSLKIDALHETIWRRINRPHGAIIPAPIRHGILAFAETYSGRLVTETMLVRGINDCDDCMSAVADFLVDLRPYAAYLSVPTRPPAEKWVAVPDEESLNRVYQLFAGRVGRVECLLGYEGNAFASTGEVEKDLLGITSVHPMREEAVGAFLSRAGSSWGVVDRLLARGDLAKTQYDGHTFYLRKFATERRANPKCHH
jgi:wyosine [tRNA(Phe)-imidazoG37] synthetase (radical SAM superfamily)